MRKHKLISLFILCAFLLPTQGFSSTQKQNPLATFTLQGKSAYRFLIWDLYDISYLHKSNSAEALKLDYKRTLYGERIAEESIKQMKRQPLVQKLPQQTLEDWRTQMTSIFPDVKDGDSITAVFNKESSTFYLNNLFIGDIKNPVFTQAFKNIWLGEHTSAPELREALLNE